MIWRRCLVVGGAGFLGSHVVDRLLGSSLAGQVTVYDNFSSGRQWHLATHDGDRRLAVIPGDAADLVTLTEAMQGHDTVIHLASNPDIARAASEPAIDFDQGTLLTHHVAEAARRTGVTLVLYASGSGVYGDLGILEASEDHGPLLPVSTYGASKLAGEGLLCAYAHMFGVRSRALRFGNVVGPRQTHGVGYDFVRRLIEDPTRLHILGDGAQSKSYVYVGDVIDAMLVAARSGPTAYEAYNVATGDYVTVREIAELAVECMGLSRGDVAFSYAGGPRGWRGDVPVVRLDTRRIRALGWTHTRTSAEALREAILSMVPDAVAGRL